MADGVRVGGIPEQAVPTVLEKLAAAAPLLERCRLTRRIRRQGIEDLAAVLDQLRRRKA
jgi:hypothetical protein